ncbi:hypothetical protein D9756_001570 [Leucocoprinus leucothites]|uniref:Uncharacterized protein n=1 Tax=Leucocoprinus leucothites TaxID=201217 RepID=A0A8H5G407_9AGAR|nr:hypothetical protein D9756_001570 [Leucoagaricus leucothites]
MSSYHIPGKVDLTPKRHHGYAILLFIMGTLLPPLAVAARFGIGKDFWLNLLLTLCGYIPGHGHNFYIQNIRNNKTHARTPKWAQKWGLVDTSEIKRKERKSQWAHRYNDRLPHSTLEGQALEEGQEAGSSSIELSTEGGRARKQNSNGNGDLWRPEDESYYNQRESSQSSGGRWRYPANFDEADLNVIPKKSKKKKDKKDRWARTQDAYTLSEEQSKKKRKSSKRKKSKSSLQDSVISRDSNTTELPEDPEGGLYGNSSRLHNDEDHTPPDGQHKKETTATTDDVFNHQF